MSAALAFGFAPSRPHSAKFKQAYFALARWDCLHGQRIIEFRSLVEIGYCLLQVGFADVSHI